MFDWLECLSQFLFFPEQFQNLDAWLALEFMQAQFFDVWSDQVYFFQNGMLIHIEDWIPEHNQNQFEAIQLKAAQMGFKTHFTSSNPADYLEALRKWVA